MNTKRLDTTQLETAVALLLEGELVAFPTETVYGLGAIATSEEAVKKVYQAKGRPSDNPLIVHVSSLQQVKDSVVAFPEVAQALVDAFWPGPLTIILQAKEQYFAPSVSFGRPTVAFRMPQHPVALELIQKTGHALVGPSANQSGKPSPTSAQHVWDDMNGRIAAICDGGETAIGLESTVVDLTDKEGIRILRPGAITAEQLQNVVHQRILGGEEAIEAEEAPKAPGMKYRHYAPSMPVQLFYTKEELIRWVRQYQEAHMDVGVMATEDMLGALPNSVEVINMGSAGDIQSMSMHLFSGMREMEKRKVERLLVQACPKKGMGIAYMNRLEKAARGE